MVRVIALLVCATPLAAQTRFEWKAGEVHTYLVSQTTTTAETLASGTSTTTAKLTLTKTWTVKSVANNTATLEMAVRAMKQEITKPGGETVVIDSATAEGANAMKEYLNKPFLTCTVDDRGRVSDVKAVLPDGAARLAAELPLRIELPAEALTKETKWDRSFTIVADGQSHDAVQSVAVETLGARTTFKVGTSLRKSPADVADWQPLLPWLWEGTVTMENNRYQGANLKIVREYPNHAGAGTKFRFESHLDETRQEK